MYNNTARIAREQAVVVDAYEEVGSFADTFPSNDNLTP